MKISKVRKQNRVQEIAPVVKHKELEAYAQTAASNILALQTKSNKKALNKEELADMIVMLAEDATYLAIKNKFRRKYNRSIIDKTISKYKKKYEQKIFDLAQNFETLSIQVGLSKRANRIRKMQRLAEALEESIYDKYGNLLHDVVTKDITEYRETLKQIALETGGIDSGQSGDVIFANITDEDLKALVANKLGGNKALSVILAESAGVRATIPMLELKNEEIETIEDAEIIEETENE